MTDKSATKKTMKSAQIIPFPIKAAKATKAAKADPALVVALQKVDRALDEQLIEVRRFRDAMAALGAAMSDIENGQRRVVRNLATTETRLRGVTVQSRSLAGSMEQCERLLSGGGRAGRTLG